MGDLASTCTKNVEVLWQPVLVEALNVPLHQQRGCVNPGKLFLIAAVSDELLQCVRRLLWCFRFSKDWGLWSHTPHRSCKAGKKKTVSTSSVPRYDCGDEESGGVGVTCGDPRLTVSALADKPATPGAPQTAILTFFYSYYYLGCFPFRLSSRCCLLGSVTGVYSISSDLHDWRIVCPRIADPQPRRAPPESGGCY